MEYLAIVLAALTSSGVCSIIVVCLQRHWQKKDGEKSKIDALVKAQKLTMIDEVKRSAKKHIRAGYISLEDKEHLIEKHEAYKALGGNGHLDTTMNEIHHLKVVDE